MSNTEKSDLDKYNNVYEELVEKIKSTRKEKKINQKEIADLLELTQGGYSDIEKGKAKFSVSKLFAVLDYLGIDILKPSKNDESSMIAIPTNSEEFLQSYIEQKNDIAELKKQNSEIKNQNDEILSLLKKMMGNDE